jgi:hypothetical protein
MPIKKAEEIKPRLGKLSHWRKERSAYELSTTWVQAGGIPAVVRAVLDRAPEWQSAELIDGIFERETEIPGRGRPSQTDLLAIVRLGDCNAILGVEGKVDETFGPLVEDWLQGSPASEQQEEGARKEPDDSNRRIRLMGLCRMLSVDSGSMGKLYYQLLHRTCATLCEAKRFRYPRAAMLVHSFAASAPTSKLPVGFPEFSAFAGAVGMPVEAPNAISHSKRFDGVDLRLAWASDRFST